MKTALILTYYWPPGSGPGVQRWLKFCKYLPEYGWQPVVVTVRNGSYPSTDESLLDDVPEGMTVIHTATLEPFRLYNMLRGKSGKQVEVGMGNIKNNPSPLARFANYVRANFFVPDARVGWNIFAFPEVLKAVKKFQPDVVITTGPPHSTHLMGQRLHESNHIPWLVDLRDPWTNIYYNEFLNRSEATKARDQRLETSVASNASALMVASPGLQEEFQDRARQIRFIPNGYDEQDFLASAPAKRKKFTLAYVGNLKAAQNVKALWGAVKELIEDAQVAEAFELEITGNVSDEIHASIRQFGLEKHVNLLPFVPHKEAIQRMVSSHALLLPIPISKGNQSILTGKLFEYLATRRPILSIGPTDGNAADIIRTCEKEPMIAYDDQQEIVRQLKHLIAEYRMHPSPMVTGNDRYKEYSRKGTTGKLAQLLEDISA